MIGWKDRKRIEEEARLRRSAETEVRAKWWRVALNIVNTPIVLAVVVSSILGFTTETFHRSETCFADLSTANAYWKLVFAELNVRLNLKNYAAGKATDDLGEVIHVFATKDLQDYQHVNRMMKEKTFIELLLDFDVLHKAFSLPEPPMSAKLFVVLPTLDSLASQQQFSTEELQFAIKKVMPEMNDITGKELKRRIDLATSEFALYGVTHLQLPYNCRWLVVARRELMREPSPFETGVIPHRSD